jgi:hypothetical protein
MDIPTCNYKYLDNEFYVKSIKNDNYIPYVFGFVISISGIGLLISIYNANLEYKQDMSNKIKLVLYIILILIFLGLLGYSGYEIGVYNTKDLRIKYSADELMIPCYSKYTKKIIGMPVSELILQEEAGLSSYSYNDTLKNSVSSDQLNPSENRTRTVTTPYNTRTSNSSSTTTGNATPGSTTLNSTANSTANLSNRVTITNNSAPPTSTINRTNVQQATQNSTGTTDERIVGTVQDGGSLIVRGP